MPKGKRKGKSVRTRHHLESALQTSDDDSFNDNISIISNYTESIEDGAGDEGDEYAQEQFEDKLIELIDGLTQKSAQGRTNCIQSLSKAFIKKLYPTFVKERLFTICDCIERSLKKGGSVEKSSAAELASILCVQLGEEDAAEVIDKMLRPLFISTACDKSVPATARAKCCQAVGMIAFISGVDLGETLSLMQQLESIFSLSYLKGDGSIPNIPQDTSNLHAAALSAWTLLLTNIPTGQISDLIASKSLPTLIQLAELLESANLDVRLTAGEALALIYEDGRKDNLEFSDVDFTMELAATMRKLATDSHKYRAKKDRKQQRATFRDLLKFIEDDFVPDLQIKFGREVLLLDTWARRKQYDEMCNILGPGINIHLMENDLLRDIFEITSSVVGAETHTQHQMERCRKRLLNAANFKARTISRAKNRDKRSDF